MKAEYNNATIKVWFTNIGVSRNFHNVTEIILSTNSYLIKMADGKQCILSIPSVNMIEEIETEDMDKKMQELKAKFKKV